MKKAAEMYCIRANTLYIKAIQIVGKTKFFDGLGWMFCQYNVGNCSEIPVEKDSEKYKNRAFELHPIC